jgi:uncharacterized protein YgiM (DUF1202 family)
MKKLTYTLTRMVLIMSLLVCSLPIAVKAADAGSSAGRVSLSSGTLNVRQAASTSSGILASLPNGGYVTLLSRSGSWWKVEYARGKTGYCLGSYIAQVSGSYAVRTNGVSLNIRSGPGTGYAVVGWLNSGEYAVVLSSSGSWKRILFNGTKTGYVNGAYLSGSPAPAYAAVSLPVPSYKQTDPRWAGTAIGTTGRTIAEIGCATTALAMAESYRTGSTITPSAMASRLRYTAGGSVYWPSHYTSYTGGDYLAKVYSLLKSGKTVLVGLKTAAGSQHWSVVTGFTGGTSLYPAGFTVNDPGSSSRTNLAQVIGAYPYFNKLMVY